MLQTIPYFTQGTQAQLSHVRVGQFKELEISANRPLHIHVDGEIYAGLDSKTTAFNANILPGFLQIVR
jgi:diacylglycerol kinase family enzyme